MALWDSVQDNDQDNGSNDLLSADSTKCPSCGSNIFYEPALDSLICRKCGNVYSTVTLEPRGSLGIKEEHDYTGDYEMSEEDSRRHEIVCNSCGAALIADENTMSTMCPFCGSPALITRRMTREFKPDYIVPFKIDRDKAQNIMEEWISSRKYTPAGFRKKSRLIGMTALYVPFWLLDCCVNSDMSGTGKKGYGLANVYEVNSVLSYYVKGVPFNASREIANKLMEAIEPFDYSEMISFENRYLQGFYADKYDQRPVEMADRIIRRIERFSNSDADLIGRKYESYEHREEKGLSWLDEINVKYCLLPVWFMTVEFKGQQYQFAVNGQTGEACGQVPTSQAADLRDDFFFYRLTPIINVLGYVVCGLPPLIMILCSIPGASAARINLIIALIVCEFICILARITAYVLRRRRDRNMKTAYETNDYDKDPGLDCYLDLSRRPDLKVKEVHLVSAVAVRNGEGLSVGQNPVDLYGNKGIKER